MKRTLKFTAVTLAVLMAGFIAGCGGNKPADAGGAKVYKIGFIQLAENGAFTEMREGFNHRLGELGYADAQLDIDYKNAQGDIGTLNTICQEMAKSNKDIVVTIATPAAQAFVNQESDIPLVFISVANPIAAGVMSSLETPDRNATGSSNLVPVDEIFQMAANLTPSVKHYGILYNSGEANAVVTVQSAKAYLDANGYTYTEAIVTNSSEVQQAAESLVSKTDAIYVPIDSMVQTAMPQVAQIARDAKVPVYGSSPVMVVSGALATVSTNDTQVGAASADIADKYFKGTPIKEIPAVALGDFIKVINKSTADIIGLVIPDAYATAILIED
jgi:putative ABC transport system substrate-binding protein